MSAYVEQVFNDVEKMRGKVLADRFRMVFKKIQLVKNDDSDEAYNLKQQENLGKVRISHQTQKNAYVSD